MPEDGWRATGWSVGGGPECQPTRANVSSAGAPLRSSSPAHPGSGASASLADERSGAPTSSPTCRRSGRHRDRRVRRWRRRVQSRSSAIPATTARNLVRVRNFEPNVGASGGRAVPAVFQATSTRRAPKALQTALGCRTVEWAPEVGSQCPQATTDHTDLPVSVCSHPQLSLSSATIRNPYPPEAIGGAARRTRGMA